MPEQATRLLASYGRLRGRKLRPSRQELVDELLPKLQLSLEGSNGVMEWWSNGAISPSPHRPTTPPTLWLEIGFGGGEHLAHQAQLNPDTSIIGCEPFINGIAALLALLSSCGTRSVSAGSATLNPDILCSPAMRAPQDFNIRIYNGDARLLVAKLPDHCLSKVFILYPDPWPKTRHHKRRLISTEFLTALARVMKPGAELRLATDDADYCAWMLERLLAHPSFRWTAKTCDGWLNPPPDWLSTRYEQKALKAGRVPNYLNFIRK